MGISAKHAYRFIFLKSEKWKNIRLQVLADKDAKCDICEHRDLSNDVHHVYYSDTWHETPLDYLMVLCRECHDRVHKMMESPEAKMNMFIDIRNLIREEKKLPKKLLPKFEKEKITAKQLRTAYEIMKERVANLEKEKTKKKKELKLEKKNRIKELKVKSAFDAFLCSNCKLNFFDSTYRIFFEMTGMTTNDNWHLRVCSGCLNYLRSESNKIPEKNVRTVRLFYESIVNRPKRRMLTN